LWFVGSPRTGSRPAIEESAGQAVIPALRHTGAMDDDLEGMDRELFARQGVRQPLRMTPGP
jgi:hypothetical protein